jgi:hypothetical protein
LFIRISYRNDVFWPSSSLTAAAGNGNGSDGQGQRGGKGEGKDGALLTARRRPSPHPPQGCQGGARRGCLTGSGHQGTGHAVLLNAKLGMPKTDVPSPPTFNVPAHRPPKLAVSSSSLVPEFKVPDAAPQFDMPKVDDPLFLMPKFDIPNMPTFVLPRWTHQN